VRGERQRVYSDLIYNGTALSIQKLRWPRRSDGSSFRVTLAELGDCELLLKFQSTVVVHSLSEYFHCREFIQSQLQICLAVVSQHKLAPSHQIADLAAAPEQVSEAELQEADRVAIANVQLFGLACTALWFCMQIRPLSNNPADNYQRRTLLTGLTSCSKLNHFSRNPPVGRYAWALVVHYSRHDARQFSVMLFQMMALNIADHEEYTPNTPHLLRYAASLPSENFCQSSYSDCTSWSSL
jgi:hypothetical protein